LSDRPTLQDLVEVRRQFQLPHEALVEKDWFVVRALAAIAAVNKGPFQLVFQGGTALSRAHRIIKESHRSFAATELPKAKVDEIAASRMDPRHDHLNALLDEP